MQHNKAIVNFEVNKIINKYNPCLWEKQVKANVPHIKITFTELINKNSHIFHICSELIRFLQFNSSVSQVQSLIVPMHLCFLCNDTEQQGNTNHQNFPKCHLFVISFDQHTCNNTNNYVNENPFFKCQTNSRGYKHSFSFYKKKKPWTLFY